VIVRALGVAAAAALVLLPFAGAPYTTTLLLPAFGYAIALLGLNLLFGAAGLLSFGHALFVAIGAYTAAALTGRAGVRSLELLLLAAAATAALVAVPVGLLCVRYVKIYFGMLTLAFGMLFYSFLYKFYTLTGGDEGMRVLRPALFGQPLEHLDKIAFLTGPFYYYALGVLAAAALVMRRLVTSPFGLSLRSIRENAAKAESLGIDVRRYRLAAFVIAAVFGAVGGVLLVVPTGLADPLLAYWTQSGNLVFMLLLGGFDHFLGPVLGAVVFILLEDSVRSLTAYWRFVFGAMLAAIVIFFPRGLMGLLDRPRASAS
jgi:branched-chain amino acid transport system permease protein